MPRRPIYMGDLVRNRGAKLRAFLVFAPPLHCLLALATCVDETQIGQIFVMRHSFWETQLGRNGKRFCGKNRTC